jgi:hypothetical protein
MDALRNSHIPFGDEWIPTRYGGLVRRSAIISARPVRLTAEGAREHHDGRSVRSWGGRGRLGARSPLSSRLCLLWRVGPTV